MRGLSSAEATRDAGLDVRFVEVLGAVLQEKIPVSLPERQHPTTVVFHDEHS
jgi:hypothetical protein